jgi:hypothetical protein
MGFPRPYFIRPHHTDSRLYRHCNYTSFNAALIGARWVANESRMSCEIHGPKTPGGPKELLRVIAPEAASGASP